MNIENIKNQVIELTRHTGAFIRDERLRFLPGMAEEKGRHDLVSYVDKTAEQHIIEGLSLILPQAGFLAEESGNRMYNSEMNWIVDPLDGTTNFVHGLPPYAISIGLMENSEVILGVIYEITLDECFHAAKSNGAYLNNQAIKVSKTENIENSLLATGFPYSDYNRLDEFMLTVSHFMRHSRGLRRLGSAATDLAYVACGRFDGFYEYGLNAWDVAAGDIIIREAGGKLCDFHGGNNHIFGKEIIASNPLVFDEFKNTISELMIQPLKK